MKTYQFYFLSPSVRDLFKRYSEKRFAKDSRAIAWAMSLYGNNDISLITIIDGDDAKKVCIQLNK